jgi:hypothetical protein
MRHKQLVVVVKIPVSSNQTEHEGSRRAQSCRPLVRLRSPPLHRTRRTHKKNANHQNFVLWISLHAFGAPTRIQNLKGIYLLIQKWRHFPSNRRTLAWTDANTQRTRRNSSGTTLSFPLACVQCGECLSVTQGSSTQALALQKATGWCRWWNRQAKYQFVCCQYTYTSPGIELSYNGYATSWTNEESQLKF